MSKEKFQLDAGIREIVGKKVKQLRNQGYVPAVVYGPNFENFNLVVDAKALRQILLHAGGTQLIELNIGGDPVQTLARDVQRNPITGDILHVDFYRVAMDRPIRANIPVVIVGEAPAVARGGAILHHMATAIEVEALPADLPPHIDVDVSGLTEPGRNIAVADLRLPHNIRLLSDPAELLVKIDLPVAEVEEVEPVAEEEAAPEPELVRRR